MACLAASAAVSGHSSRGLGGFRQRLALFALRLPIECVAVDPAGHVALRRGRVDAIGVAEAGFRRARAGDGNDGAVFAARGIARVCRLGKEHAVQHVQRAHVAGAGAEEHERLIRLFRHADGDVLAFHFEVYDVLRLREERVFGAVHGLQHVQPQGFLRAPGAEIHLLRALDGRDDFAEGGDQIAHAAHSQLIHHFAPPLETTDGSTSPVV